MTLRPGFSYRMLAFVSAALSAQSPMANQKPSAANTAIFPATAERFMYESLAPQRPQGR